MEDNLRLTPRLQDEVEKALEHTVKAETEEDAEDWFVDAKNRLLDVNHWRQYGHHLNAEFTLADAHGKAVNRSAHRGDHLHIDIPGSGSGVDWVVDAIVYDDYPDINRETITVRVRPSSDLKGKQDHDLTPSSYAHAAGAFVVERVGKMLRTIFQRRSEPSNAGLGLPDVQWEALTKGLLEG
jgi:hypothetical protein